MDNNENKATVVEDKCCYKNVHPKIKQHVVAQAIKRHLPESVILEECIQYHQEHAST